MRTRSTLIPLLRGVPSRAGTGSATMGEPRRPHPREAWFRFRAATCRLEQRLPGTPGADAPCLRSYRRGTRPLRTGRTSIRAPSQESNLTSALTLLSSGRTMDPLTAARAALDGESVLLRGRIRGPARRRRAGAAAESSRDDRDPARGSVPGIARPMMSPPLDPDGLRAALESAGRRCTPQRLAVYDHLCRAEHHPTAEEVYQGVKAVIPNISLATVYKALESLVAGGLAAKLTAGDGSARYDARSDHHYHLRCLRSGTVKDLPTPFDPDLIAKLDPSLAATLRRQGFPGDGLSPRAGRLLRRPDEPRAQARHSQAATTPWSTPTPTWTIRRLRAICAGVLDRASGRGRPDRRDRHDGRRQREVVELARRRGVFAAVGVQPNDAAEAGPATGSGWSRSRPSRGRRHRRDRARPLPGPHPLRPPAGVVRPAPRAGPERGLPVVIHCRESRPTHRPSAARPAGSGVLHSFTGAWDDAQAFLELGLHLSFAGMVTFTNKGLDPLRDVAARVAARPPAGRDRQPLPEPAPAPGTDQRAGPRGAHGRTHRRAPRPRPRRARPATTENARRLFVLPDDDLL